MRVRVLPLAMVAASLAGCVTTTTNPQNPTATEQLLGSHAARRAAEQINLVCRPPAADHCIPRGRRVYLQVRAGGDTAPGRFAAAEVSGHLAAAGVALVDDRVQADVVVDLVVAAAGIDDEDLVLGVASMTLPPIPGKTSSPTTTPQVSLYSSQRRTGVVELEAIARDARTGAFVSAVGPVSATARLVHGSIFTGLTWGPVRELPEIRAQR